jgi:RsiW-degrading membrane proteinase PrsW (M82 family)
MRAMSRWSLVVRVGMAGAFAGFAAWAVALAAHILFGVGRPTGILLLLAILRGTLIGVIVALILHAFWNRPSGRNESKGRL